MDAQYIPRFPPSAALSTSSSLVIVSRPFFYIRDMEFLMRKSAVCSSF
jgi:hypothetical protein